MKTKKSYLALVHFNGRVYNGPEGVMYDGPPPKPVNIKGCTTMDMLRQNIHSRLKLQSGQVLLSVVYRFRLQEKEAKYMAIELGDDEDLASVFDAYEHTTDYAMELYVDVATNESHHCTIEPQQRRPSIGPSIGTTRQRVKTKASKDRLHMEHLVRRVDPGPRDTSLLDMQQKHVSQHIWDGKPDRVLRIRRAQHYHHTPPPDAIVPLLRQAGFHGIAMSAYVPIDHQLISALVERWRPETHTFHMPQGETTVTLQDVAIQLGLPIHGRAVTGPTILGWAELIHELLGVQLPSNQNVIKGGRLRMTWLDSHFGQLDQNANAVTIERYARAYILRLIGGVLFPDHSGTYVHLMHLDLLRDFGQASTYSWGSACLAYLYRELCKATDYEYKEIGGCCLLLQLWAWERFPTIGPRIIGTPDLKEEVGTGPLARRWHLCKSYLEYPPHSLGYYRHTLDRLQLQQITWMPYTQEVTASLPGYCLNGSDVWRAVVPLIHFQIVEWHQPDRVLRQFGLKQLIPKAPSQVREVHAMQLTGRHDTSWYIEHQPYIAIWDDRRNQCVVSEPASQLTLGLQSKYMKWYRLVTRRFITPFGGALDLVVEEAMALQEYSTPEGQSNFSFDKLRIATEVILQAIQQVGDVFISSHAEQAPALQHMPTPPQYDQEDDRDAPRGRRRRRPTPHTNVSSTSHAT